MNKLIEEHDSRTKLKFLHRKLLEAQSEVTELHEQLMEELAVDDPLFNDDWITEVNKAVAEWSSDVNEYLLSRVNDPPSDVMSNTAWVEDCLKKSERHVTEREQISDLAKQLHQLTTTSNQQMVHADVHDIKEAVNIRKPSEPFNQLQHPLEIQVYKQSHGEYGRTPSVEARPFAVFQVNKEKAKYFNEQKQRKSQPDSRLKNTITMDLSEM